MTKKKELTEEEQIKVMTDFVLGKGLYPEVKPYKKNKCMCKGCGTIIESKHRHDFVHCRCGAIFTDGGLDYIRRGGRDLSMIIDLSEENPDYEKDK